MQTLFQRIVVWRYTVAGLSWGDWESYSFMASAREDNPHTSAYHRWKSVYDKFGYEEIPSKVWIDAGGYGIPYKNYLYKPKPPVVINP